MPRQPEVFVRDLERASDEAESALVRAMIVYSAVNDQDEEEEEDEDEGLLVFFLRSAVAGFAAAVITLTERHDDRGTVVPQDERDRISAAAIAVARDALRDAVRADPTMLSGDGDVSRTERLRRVAETVITSVRSEVQIRLADTFGFVSKTWTTMRDTRVRTLHRELEGVTVPVDERFTTTSYTIAFPGDRSAPPQGWIGCRCSLRFST